MHSSLVASLLAAVVLAAACGGQTSSGETQSDGGAGEASAGAGGGAGSGGSAGAGAGGAGGGAGVEFSSCTGDGQCVLRAPGCCGDPCGAAPLSAFAAINVNETQAFFDATCDQSGGAIGCPACMSQRDPHFTARCASGQCQAVDVAPLSTCATDADCSLRYGASCCPTGCDPSQLIAVSQQVEAEIGEWSCGPNPVPCAACPAPANVGAVCVDGLCAVVGFAAGG